MAQITLEPEVIDIPEPDISHIEDEPALVPDMLLSLDVHLPEELWEKKHRSYFIWEYGKPPEVVVEVVSNRKGGATARAGDRTGGLNRWSHSSIIDYQEPCPFA